MRQPGRDWENHGRHGALAPAAGAKKLRRLFVVLPFTNIIDQAVEVYRKSLVVPGEDPESVVAAVHHKADYKDPDSRHLAALWDAPVVVTTAVQFFETLAAASTGGLRKLHNLVGAGVFIDESHACLPAKLWPGHGTGSGNSATSGAAILCSALAR